MNRMMVLVLAAGCALAGFAEGFVVAKDGAAACAVVAGEFAKPAAELTNYLHRITGATFDVVKRTEEAGERPVIVLEKGEAARDKDKFVAWQSYALKSSAKRLRLVSPHPRGMLYAVYGLLRDHCGVGFYSPAFEVVPKNANLVLDVDDVQKPAFRWRGYGWWDFRPHWRPFIFKNRGGGLPTETLTSAHSLYTWVKAQENFKTHPEWFAMDAKGTRRLDAAMGVCGTNPGLAAELAKNMVAWYRKNNPSNLVEKQVLSIGHGDGWTPCLCKDCVALSEAEESETAPFILMMNRALEIARREVPDAQIITDAYFGSLMPPKTIKLNDGLWIDCTCGSIAVAQAGDQINEIAGTPANRWYRKALEGWAKLGDGRVTTYQWTDPLNAFYSEWPNFFSRCNDIRYISSLGVAGCLAEHLTNPNWSCWARDYVWLSLMWNPQEDERQLFTRWITAYYGPKAAPVLMRYVDYVEQVRKDAKYGTPTVRWSSYPRYMTDKLFDRATCERMDAILDEAVAAAKAEDDPVYAERVWTMKGGSVDELMLNGAMDKPFGEVREPGGETWFVRGADPKAPDRIRRLAKFVTEVDAGHKWDPARRLMLALPPHGGRADPLAKGASKALVVKDFSGQVVSLKVGGTEVFSQKKGNAGYRDTIPGAEKNWTTVTNAPDCHAVTAQITPHPWYNHCGRLVFARTVVPTDDGLVVTRGYSQPKHDKSNRALPAASRFNSSWILDLPNPAEAGVAVVGGGVKGAVSLAGLDPNAKSTTVRQKRAADMFSDAQVAGIDDQMETLSASDRTFKFTETNGAVSVVFNRGDGVTVKIETVADGWESVTLKPDLATRTLEVAFSARPWKGNHEAVRLTFPEERVRVMGRESKSRVEVEGGVSKSKVVVEGRPKIRRTGANTAVNEIDGMELVYVPAGAFIRGSDDPNAPRDERPRRKIEVSGFWIAKTPVTFAQLKKFAAATDRPKPTEDWPQTPLYDRTKPVDVVPANVSWVTADAYAKWACGRLPTEAEWMKAARGDKDARVYPWGDKWDPTKAVGIEMTYDRQRGGLAPVGMLPAGASPYGCLDMSGNVFEWVGDWYASDYWAKSPAKDPTGPATGRNRVLKGGSYCFSEDHARIDARFLCEPIQYDCMAIGFRYVIPDGDRTR